jgi:hypothetical protein
MKACVMGDISKGRPKSIMEKTCMIPYWFWNDSREILRT